MSSKLAARVFFLVVFGLPLGQAAWELSRGERIQALDVWGPVSGERLRRFEDDLRQASFLHRRVTPWYQWLLTRAVGRGNEKAIVGDEGWLYYSEDLDYVTEPGFLRGAWTPVDAIADLKSQLARAGANLLLVPVPPKVTADPSHLSGRTTDLAGPANSDAEAFLVRLREVDVAYVDLMDVYRELRAEGEDELYLARDTHWSPRTMERAAEAVAASARQLLPAPADERVRWDVERDTAAGAGDIVGMLRLPEARPLFEPLRVEIARVRDAKSGAPFAPDRGAEVLLLGDSFTRVFSDPDLGLGAGAGFAEHVARALDAPLDVISIAGGSALAARESLARRAGGLEGTRLVVWQISMRDLVAGAELWRRVEIPAHGMAAGRSSSRAATVLAEVVETTRISAEFEYAFCLAVYEYRVLETLEGEVADGPLWVAHVGMRDFEPTPENFLEVGSRQRLVLEPIERHYDLEETSWMDDTAAGLDIWFPVGFEDAEASGETDR